MSRVDQTVVHLIPSAEFTSVVYDPAGHCTEKSTIVTANTPQCNQCNQLSILMIFIISSPTIMSIMSSWNNMSKSLIKKRLNTKNNKSQTFKFYFTLIMISMNSNIQKNKPWTNPIINMWQKIIPQQSATIFQKMMQTLIWILIILSFKNIQLLFSMYNFHMLLILS